MTLVEMSVSIAVLLIMVGVMFIGARAWIRGSARSKCIMHISLVQRTMRGYANLYNFPPGATAPNLLNQIVGSDRFLKEMPVCPADGVYSYGDDFGVDTIPPMGTVYMKCSLASSENHAPEVTLEW